MAFLDFNAAEGAPIHAIGAAPAAQSRAWLQPRRRSAPARRWHRLMLAIAAIPALGAPAVVAADYLGDAMLGVLSATLLYAMGAPVAFRLLWASAARPRASY